MKKSILVTSILSVLLSVIGYFCIISFLPLAVSIIDVFLKFSDFANNMIISIVSIVILLIMLVLLVLQLVFYIKNKKFANLVVCATWILSSLSLVLVVPSILIYVELFKTDFLNVIKDNIPYMVCLLVIIIGYIIGVLSVIFGLISCKAEKAEEVVLEEANEEVPISSSEPTEEIGRAS